MNDHRGRERHARAKQILLEILALDPENREERLSTACAGDDELEAEVRSLLAHETSPLAAGLDRPASEHLADMIEEEADISGTVVGAYRLDRLLGRGGMGSVYLASRTDGEFRKQVAVKLIRRSVASPELLRRFRAERQILADIEHPNVARLIDGGTLPNRVPYLLMEYVDGATLADRLAEGPLSVDEVLDYAEGIASALAAIHERGLVFRDLKPSNVMRRADGLVKLVDFGIAKPMDWRSATSADAPGSDLTEPGVVVGSPSYMSPEQALGDSVDPRTDIFAFGAVVFHALTGSLPFRGETRRSYIAEMVGGRVRELPTDLPPPLRRLVEDCLQKEPSSRPASGAELVERLEGARAAQATPSAWRAWAVVGAGIGLLASAWLLRSPTPGTEISIPPPAPLIGWATLETDPRISPDGRWVSFISNRGGSSGLWLATRAGDDVRPLPTSEGPLASHIWGPDSNTLAVLSSWPGRSVLALEKIDGTTPAEIQEVALNYPELVAWRDGSIYLSASGILHRLDLSNGRLQSVLAAPEGGWVVDADVSQDGHHVVLVALRDGMRSLWTVDLRDPDRARRLTDFRLDPRAPRWLGDGLDEIVYLSREGGQTDLWHMLLDSGARTRLTFSPSEESELRVSADGTLMLLAIASENSTIETADPRRSPVTTQPLTLDSRIDDRPSAARDGSVIAFERSERIDFASQRQTNVFEMRPDADDLPYSIGRGDSTLLSPDGRWIAFLRKLDPEDEIWLRDRLHDREFQLAGTADRPNTTTPTLDRLSVKMSWTDDSSRLYFAATAADGAPRLSWVDVTADPPAVLTAYVPPHPSDRLEDVRTMPDSTRAGLLVHSAARGRWELVEFDPPDAGPQVRHTVEYGASPRFLGWRKPTSGHLLALSGEGAGPGVDVEVIERSPEGVPRSIATLPQINPGSLTPSRFDDLLYFSQTDRAIHALYRLPLASGVSQRVLSAETPGRAFGSVSDLTDGRLLYARRDFDQDIWKVEIAR